MLHIHQPDHPMLRGLRFFAFGDNVVSLKDIANRGGGPGVASGSPTLAAGGLGGFPAINGDGSDNLITFDPFTKYFGSDSRDITVICRIRANSATQQKSIAWCKSSTPTGWMVHNSNFSSGETGWTFVVWSAANHFMEAETLGVDAAAINGQDIVFAGTYRHFEREVYAYLRMPGEPYATLRGSHSNTNSGAPNIEDWDIRPGATQPLYLLGHGDGSNFCAGDLAWIAVFDRWMFNEEIAAFSKDESWPFVHDYDIDTNYAGRIYTTAINVNQSAGYAGPSRGEANAIDVAGYTAGDLASESGGSVINKNYNTVVNVYSAEAHGQPLFKQYTTTVSAGGVATRAMKRSYETKVGVGSKGTLLIDGRRDIMFTNAYRR